MDNLSSQPELPREATAPDDFVGGRDEPALHQSPPALLPELDGQEPSPVAALEIPIASAPPPVALLLPDADHAHLENRLQRLEAELAQMRGAATRVTDQPAPPAGFWGRLLHPSTPARSTHSPSGLPSMLPGGVRQTWLLFDALAELRAMYWMFFDPRYHLSWTARLAPLLILLLILTSYYWTPGTILPFFIGAFIEKMCDLILAYFLFKLLSYEARRYRETAPDLPPSLRL